jgi:L-amino acid N-acyltransferase YncA
MVWVCAVYFVTRPNATSMIAMRSRMGAGAIEIEMPRAHGQTGAQVSDLAAMKSTVTVRASEERDLASIAAIYSHHVLNGLATFEIEAPDESEMTRRRAQIVGWGLPFLVAEREGRVVGYAYAAPYRARPAYRYTLEDSIYVAQDAVGQGAGRALLDALVAACARAGYRQLIAVIGDSANTASIGLHAACGFEHAGLLQGVGFKFGRWVDSVLMQMELGEGRGSVPAALRPRPE